MKHYTKEYRKENEYLQFFRGWKNAFSENVSELYLSDLDNNNQQFKIASYSVVEDRIIFLHPGAISGALTGGIVGAS